MPCLKAHLSRFAFLIYSGPVVDTFKDHDLMASTTYDYEVTALGTFNTTSFDPSGTLGFGGEIPIESCADATASTIAEPPMLQSLTANGVTANAGGSANLTVTADANGNATLNLGAMYTPSNDGQDIPWSISGVSATPSSGTFSNSSPTVALTGLTANSSFTITAGTSDTGIATIQGDVTTLSLSISAPSLLFTVGVTDYLPVTVTDAAGDP